MRLRWFGGLDHEWRSGPKPTEAGFWVLLWSRDPQRLWWELLDAFEQQSREGRPRAAGSPKAEVLSPNLDWRSQSSLQL